MRIRKLNLKNIGPFEDTEIEFKPSDGTQEIHILTGPNGSGKTTVLYALSSFFGPSNWEPLLKRMQSNGSVRLAVEVPEASTQELINFDINRTRLTSVGAQQLFFQNEYPFAPNLPKFAFSNARQRWFAFASSGYRVVRSVPINAIQELESKDSDGLIFDKQLLQNDRSRTINQWIANNISKRALSKEKGNTKDASKYASAVTRLENAISAIVGYKIEFELKTSPLSLIIRANNTELEFDVLPDGLRSAISWIGDLLMHLDIADWNDEQPINEQRIFLFLDEIEVHLHPAWQRKILPVVKEFFPNATIFLTTHSPFVVNSVDGAWVYELKVKDGKAYLGEVTESKSSASYRSVLREVFDIEKPFGGETQDELDKFQQQRDQILRGEDVNEKQFIQRARKLAKQGEELLSIISLEIKQINHIKGTNYEL